MIQILLNFPIQFLSFFALGAALLSLWVKKTPILFISFGAISLFLAFESKIISSTAFLPICFLILLLWGLNTQVQGFPRFLLGATAFLIAGALFFSLMPGFELVGGSPPLNYGKAFMGFLLLSQTVTTLPGRQLPKAILPAIYVSVALAIISLILKTPPIEWTFSLSFFSWAFVTLIFCLTAEEALLRGFLQKELFHWVGGGLKGHISSIAVLSLLYPLFHLHWVGDLSLLAPILLTGIALASLYQYYENVETCIFCHFFIRSIGFIAFGGYLS